MRPVYEEVCNNSNVLIRKDETGKLVIDYETPEYQEAIKTLRDWYQKGYIRSDVASAGNDTAGWNAGKYAVDIATWKPGLEAIDNSGYAPGRDWVFGNQFNAYVPANADSDVWQKTEEMNENSIKSPLIGFTPDISTIRTELSQLSSVIDEYSYQTTGAHDPAEYWDDFVQKMETAGQKKVLEKLQKQVDEFLASK